MSTLPPNSLRLFGTFHFFHQGTEVELGQPRLEELIAMLAIHPGEPVRRAQIASNLWPESSESQARTNLRNLLFKLKAAWPGVDDAITVEHTYITWRSDSTIAVDVSHFDALADRAERSQDTADPISLLSAAVDGYGGDLFPSCFSDWILTEREQRRHQYASLLEQLVNGLLERRQYEDALQRAKALQRFDPLRESTFRQLMQVHLALGDRAAALRVYHACSTMLQRELGVEPAPATEAVHAQLLRLQTAKSEDYGLSEIQRPQMVGRHNEWQQLQTTWRETQQGVARCILILGEAGIGKTRLAEELIDWVQNQGHVAASSRAYTVEGALTYAPIAEWLRSPGIRPVLDNIDDLWRVELARLLPDLLADRPDLPPPGPMTENWQQQRFFQSIVRSLQAVAGPLVLHMDDMQWSDAETLTLLQFLLHGGGDHQMLLIGGVRSEDAGDNQPLAAFVEATRHAGQLVELHLGPLSRQETAKLAELTSDEGFEPDGINALYASSEGHPLFLIEAVRSGLTVLPTMTDPVPSKPSDIKGVASMPPRIYNLLRARLGQLSEAAQQVASMAAVIGRAFDYNILQHAVSLDEITLIDTLDELWQRHIIREQAGDAYDFSHDRIREVAYQEISRARRRLYHRQVAIAMIAVRRDDLDDVAGELATHYAQAGDSEAAYRNFRRAAEVALTQHALPHAEIMLDAALSHISDDPLRRLEVLLYQDHVFARSLQFERWKANLDEERALLSAMDAAEPQLSLAHELSRSRYYSTLVEGSEAVAAAETAVKIAEQIEDKSALAQGYRDLGNGYWIQTRLADSARAYGLSAQFAKEAGELALESGSLQLQAEPGMFSGMAADDIYSLLSRGLEIAESIDNKQDIPDILGKLAYWRVTRGMGGFDLAEQEYERALEVAKEIGHRLHEEMVWSNLGVLFTHKGEYQQALKALQTAIDMGQGDSRFWRYWVAHHYRGAAWMQMGCLDAAYDDLTLAIEQLHQLGNRHYEVKAHCDLGLVHHLGGNHDLAQSVLNLALTLLGEYGDTRFEALGNTRMGYALEAMGQLVGAAKCFEQGRDLHDQMGQHYYALNAQAGLARIAVLQGEDGIALDYVTDIWETIGGKEMDATIESARTLRTCYMIFDANDIPHADAVLEMAWEQLQLRVSTIDEAAHIEQFWQVDDHRFFHDLM